MKRRRRLLSVAHSYVVTMNRRLVHELAVADPEGWEVTAVAPTFFQASNDLRPVRLSAQPDEPGRLLPVHAYGTGRVHTFVYGRPLRSLLAEPWDLVHCWEEPYIFAGAQTAWWTADRVPIVFFSAQNLDKRYPIPFNWVEQYTVARAAGLITCGRLVVDTLKRRPGYGRLPMVEIPMGTDVARFRPDPEAARRVRQTLGWEEGGPPVAGYLGRFVEEKGVGVMMRALNQVRAPWRALFVGAGPMEADLRSWARRHGDRVRISSAVEHDQVPCFLNAMDLLCAPSQSTPAGESSSVGCSSKRSPVAWPSSEATAARSPTLSRTQASLSANATSRAGPVQSRRCSKTVRVAKSLSREASRARMKSLRGPS